MIHSKCDMPATIKMVVDDDWNSFRVIHPGHWCEQIIDLDGSEEELITLGNTSSKPGQEESTDSS